MLTGWIACGLFCYLTFPDALKEARGAIWYHKGTQAFFGDDYEQAAQCLSKARALVPSEPQYEDLEAYYQGFVALSERKHADAVRWFRISLDVDSNSVDSQRMLFIAQRFAAVDRKSLDAYFKASEALAELEGETARAALVMAPAWAWKAITPVRTEPEARTKAMECLARAAQLGAGEPEDFPWIEAWVKHILTTRAMVSFEDYWRAQGNPGLPGQESG